MESHDGCQIITLQFGHYSNHVGSHFWNIQSESLLGIVPSKDEDPGDAGEAPQVLFRDRKASAESCRRLRPRMVCVDLKGERGPQNLTTEDGTWSTAGAAQEQQGPSGSLMWDGAVMEVDSSSGPRSKCSWSSYLSKSVYLDPWSHVVLEDYRLAGCDPFDVFGMGLHLKLSALDEIEDAIRRHAEDCDNLRGFHVLSDADTGFGGLTVRVAEAILADQYPSKAGLHFPTFAPFAYPKAMVHEELEEAGSQLPVRPHLDRFLNTVLTLSALVSPSSAASIVTPLSLVNTYLPLSKYPEHSEDMTSWLHSRKFKQIQYCQHLSYQTSAVLASALDTATLPWRLKASTAKLWNICGALASPGGRKLAGMALAAPIPSSIDGRDLSFAESVGAAKDGNYLTSLTPDSDLPSLRNRQVFPQIISIRSSGPFGRSGVEGQLTRRPRDEDMVQSVLKAWGPEANGVFSVTLHDRPSPTKPPYPQIFQGLSKTGKIRPTNKSEDLNRPGMDNVHSLPLMTLWHGHAEGTLNFLAQRSAKLNWNKFHRFTAAGLENEDLIEAAESLSSLAHLYQPQSDLISS